MFPIDLQTAISRRHALALGGGLTGALATAGLAPAGVASAATEHRRHRVKHGRLPADDIQDIIEAEGSLSHGVLSIDIARDDIGDVQGPLGVTFTPAFEVNGALTFQPLGDKHAFFNGDLALKGEETNRVIDAINANGLVFQAFHQHYQTDPQIWFIHWRGTGRTLHLARAVRAVLRATSTPRPQSMASNPKTPLDAERLGKILHGDAQVGDEGVVTVEVSRKGRIIIGDVVVEPEANISTNIEIKPLNPGGTFAAAAPDFSLATPEIRPVTALMRRQGFDIGCLYNQETNEHPQLYFAHMLKTGDPYQLAHQIRKGLAHTHAD